MDYGKIKLDFGKHRSCALELIFQKHLSYVSYLCMFSAKWDSHSQSVIVVDHAKEMVDNIANQVSVLMENYENFEGTRKPLEKLKMAARGFIPKIESKTIPIKIKLNELMLSKDDLQYLYSLAGGFCRFFKEYSPNLYLGGCKWNYVVATRKYILQNRLCVHCFKQCENQPTDVDEIHIHPECIERLKKLEKSDCNWN